MSIQRSKAVLIGATLLGLALTAVVLATVDFDARAIRRQCAGLVAALNKPAGENNPLASALRVRRVLDYFAQQPALEPGEPLAAIRSREELTAVAGQALLAAESIRVRILDEEFAWTQPRTEAVMQLTVEVTVHLGSEISKLLRPYEVTWIREDSRWVIARARGTDSIRRPAASE